MKKTHKNKIDCLFLSQEDLLRAGCFDIKMAMKAAEKALLAYHRKDVIFPDKIVQIFDAPSQSRINCLPATLLNEQVCGVKWVSVFPENPTRHGLQNLSAVIVLSEIKTGFPLALMEGTLCSNMRVGAMGAIAAKHFAPPKAESIGFIGAGEQAKMHLVAMKTAFPSLKECRVSARHDHREKQFAREMKKLFQDMRFLTARQNPQKAMEGADILVTATSAQEPLLQAAWMKPGSFYSHIGGWEDSYDVAKQCDKIVCDDWEATKHRTQTLSRMFQDGVLQDADIHADLHEVVAGSKASREKTDERIYFSAVGLSYVDVSLAYAMFERARAAGVGQKITLQKKMTFEHKNLLQHLRL